MKIYSIALTGLLVAACSNEQPTTPADAYTPAPGSHQKLREMVGVADGLEVIINDVVIPPDAELPRHYHPGEEYLYVIEGETFVLEDDKPEKLIRAGDAHGIPARLVHGARGGPQGARAIVFRVHIEGEPERILVEDE